MNKLDSKSLILQTRLSFFLLLTTFCLFLSDCGPSEKEMEVMYQKGISLFIANKRDEALKVFKDLYKENENYKDVKFMLGKLLYYNRRFQDAEKNFQEISDKDDTDYNALGWLIKTQFAETPLKKDLTDNLEKYLSKNSENIEILFISARLLEETGKSDQAILAYQKIISQTQLIAFSHSQLKNIYSTAKLDKKAAYHHQKYLDLMGQTNVSEK
ncbi:tetratricopeptide repeat protein [Leptospira interrogans]|uniref:tetratricopeptide repeat protein n=1 Tax=Leptospira interrogans TaxID=173 RepID=UPI00051C75A2|nr:tetratricopeptide repeat protein [Leptospira interrogans]